MKRLEILLLVDNSASQPGLCAEHGLSMWITVNGKHILFDTGAGNALAPNTAALGVDLCRAGIVVLSHGHFDHTGGLGHLFSLGTSPKIYMHPGASQPRYGCLQTPPHIFIGMRPAIADALTRRAADILPVSGPAEIDPGVWITGPIPRRTAFEDTGGPFFTDETCLAPDPITDDQAMWIETRDGIVLLLGCAHSGVVNTLEYVSELTNDRPFLAVVGGMHLLNASPERLEETISALQRRGIPLVAPCHCTGETVIPLLAGRLPRQYTPAAAGIRFTWEM